jgi:diguanylate cyclase (GGDEF)-like protein
VSARRAHLKKSLTFSARITGQAVSKTREVELTPVTASIQFRPEDFPNSRYARELESGFRALRFNAEVEREFAEVHLKRLSLRVRLWFLLGTLFSSGFLIRSLLDPRVGSNEPWLQTLVFTVHSVMLLFTFTPWFQPYYLRVGRCVVPLICGLCTATSVMQVARGRSDLLMLIAMRPILIFFIAGLMFRSAVTSVLVSVVTFVAAAVYCGLAPTLLYSGTAILVASVVIGALVAWDTEHTHRENFLESRLLGELAVLDGLTGVKNRRAFDEHLTRVWHQASREQRSFALLLIDCDHFKRYNDDRGHQAGDEALRRIARIVDSIARRPLDLAARYGGEEFALVLYDVPESGARRIAEELRTAVERAGIEHDRSFAASVLTVSVGVALIRQASSGDACMEAVQLADQALYAAKRSGRNCVCFSQRAYPSAPGTLFLTA